MKEVVVVIHYVGDRVPMQLRDEKDEIDFPDYWGGFGGPINVRESASGRRARTVRRNGLSTVGIALFEE